MQPAAPLLRLVPLSGEAEVTGLRPWVIDRLWDAGSSPALVGEMETQRWPLASLSHSLKELRGCSESVTDWSRVARARELSGVGWVWGCTMVKGPGPGPANNRHSWNTFLPFLGASSLPGPLGRKLLLCFTRDIEAGVWRWLIQVSPAEG